MAMFRIIKQTQQEILGFQKRKNAVINSFDYVASTRVTQSSLILILKFNSSNFYSFQKQSRRFADNNGISQTEPSQYRKHPDLHPPF